MTHLMLQNIENSYKINLNKMNKMNSEYPVKHHHTKEEEKKRIIFVYDTKKKQRFMKRAKRGNRKGQNRESSFPLPYYCMDVCVCVVFIFNKRTAEPMRFCYLLLLLAMMVHVVIFVSFCTSATVSKSGLWMLPGWNFARQKEREKIHQVERSWHTQTHSTDDGRTYWSHWRWQDVANLKRLES